tara:strand:- start:122 stop:379 length:258 start_codon:yes stop_codon:yes gene_type:complete
MADLVKKSITNFVVPVRGHDNARSELVLPKEVMEEVCWQDGDEVVFVLTETYPNDTMSKSVNRVILGWDILRKSDNDFLEESEVE